MQTLPDAALGDERGDNPVPVRTMGAGKTMAAGRRYPADCERSNIEAVDSPGLM